MINDKEEIRILKNAYARAWRRKNPEKVKATNERFYKKLKEEQKLNNNK